VRGSRRGDLGPLGGGGGGFDLRGVNNYECRNVEREQQDAAGWWSRRRGCGGNLFPRKPGGTDRNCDKESTYTQKQEEARLDNKDFWWTFLAIDLLMWIVQNSSLQIRWEYEVALVVAWN
jgi:hypothetical protein